LITYNNDTLQLTINNPVAFPPSINPSDYLVSVIGISDINDLLGLTITLTGYTNSSIAGEPNPLSATFNIIPPSMVSNVSDLQGENLFKTIGETTSITELAGYPSNLPINSLKNSLVPTVGQIVDLLNYLGLGTYMDYNKVNDLQSTN
jgi:hypothetical protein